MSLSSSTDPDPVEIGPPPPLDPECAAALAEMADFLPASITPDLIPALRSQPMAQPTDDDLARGGTFVVDDRVVPGPEGAPDISLLICRPAEATAPTPVIYHVHGGGMIIGDNRTGVEEFLDWAAELGTGLVSVEYRLAPETPHPGPVEDCYAGLVWTAENAEKLGFDRERIVIAGGSAGGGLAAAVSLLARDRKGPRLLGQMLICPMLDDRNATVSAAQMAGLAHTWNRESNQTGWQALLGDACGGPDVSPYAAPARATDLSGLPPSLIDVGSTETFRDEAVAYATRIWQCGGIAELHVWPGGFHGYSLMAPHAQISQGTTASHGQWLRRLLAP